MTNGRVRTVLGDVDPAELGVTYCHEHLIIDSPIVASRFPQIHLTSVAEAVAEVNLCRGAGVGAMVDAMPDGGRDIDRLRDISRQTGLHIISATGLHTAKYYEHPLEESADELARRFAAEIEMGCGVIKVATGPEGMDDRSRRLFEAAASAHAQTGAPIITHCEDGMGGLEQTSILLASGVDLARVVLSHTDKVTDERYHCELLEAGVNLEYDQALRQAGSNDEVVNQSTAELLNSMVEAGFGSQLMLGTDGARRTLWAVSGGSPGLAWLLTGFVSRCREKLGPENIERILVTNPARWLTFS